MLRNVKFRVVGSVVAVAVLAFATAGQGGDLDPPPGPIEPTMKTLDQVEPRTLIVPTDGAKGGDGRQMPIPCPAGLITLPGSYVLTAPCTVTAGLNGIDIMADNVTVDLKGFTIEGLAGSLDGIVVTGAHKNITIVNGTIAEMGQNGIAAPGADQCRISNLRVTDSDPGAFDGIRIKSGTIDNCLVQGSSPMFLGSGDAIEVDGNSTITSCTVGAWATGIRAGTWSRVTDCNVVWTGSGGIIAANDTVVSNCSLSLIIDETGTSAAIEVTTGCHVFGNTIIGGALIGSNGIHVTGLNNRIEGNTFEDDHMVTGIEVTGPDNLIIKNKVRVPGGTPYNIAAGNTWGNITVVGPGPFLADPWANLQY